LTRFTVIGNDAECENAERRIVRAAKESPNMPLINVKVIEGVFSEDQKRTIVEKLTNAMTAIEGENLRPVTWVVIEEVKGGNWAIGGKPLTAVDVKAMATGRAA
jgi:4-oxalocrotonate tautomerase